LSEEEAARHHRGFPLLPRFTSEARIASMIDAGSALSLDANQALTAARTTAARDTLHRRTRLARFASASSRSPVAG
jgi:hypothetical protein